MELKPKEICGGLLKELPGPIYLLRRSISVNYYDDLQEALRTGFGSSCSEINQYKKDCPGLRWAVTRRDAFANALDELKGKED